MDGNPTIPDIERLVAQHLDGLYRFAYRLTGSHADAEDLVQETFLIAQRKLAQLRDAESAFAWLVKILRSCRCRQLRTSPPRQTVALEEIPEDVAESAGAWDEVERLLAIVQEMPDEYREPLLLFYFEELRYRDIAEALDCPIGTVMSRLARAKAHLRTKLTPHGCGQRNESAGP